MDKKIVSLIFMILLIAGYCLLLTFPSHAMGSTPPLSSKEAQEKPAIASSEEALAKEQIENLKNISINSNNLGEGYAKFIKDVYSGKRYLYDFNGTARRELLRVASDKNENWKYRYSAIEFLGSDDPPESFDALIKIYRDKNERIQLRRSALGAATGPSRKLRRSEVVDILIEALNDDDDEIALTAADGLGAANDERAIFPLIRAVDMARKRYKELLKSGWEGYKQGHSTLEGGRLRAAIRALGELKAKEAIPLLIKVMEDLDYDHENDLDCINGYAAMALGYIGDESALPAMKRAQKEKKYKQRLFTYDSIQSGIDKIEKNKGKDVKE